MEYSYIILEYSLYIFFHKHGMVIEKKSVKPIVKLQAIEVIASIYGEHVDCLPLGNTSNDTKILIGADKALVENIATMWDPPVMLVGLDSPQ